MLGGGRILGGKATKFWRNDTVIFEVIMTYFDIFKLHQVIRDKNSKTFCCYVV